VGPVGAAGGGGVCGARGWRIVGGGHAGGPGGPPKILTAGPIRPDRWEIAAEPTPATPRSPSSARQALRASKRPREPTPVPPVGVARTDTEEAAPALIHVLPELP